MGKTLPLILGQVETESTVEAKINPETRRLGP